jgi:hypothetical protein
LVESAVSQVELTLGSIVKYGTGTRKGQPLPSGCGAAMTDAAWNLLMPLRSYGAVTMERFLNYALVALAISVAILYFSVARDEIGMMLGFNGIVTTFDRGTAGNRGHASVTNVNRLGHGATPDSVRMPEASDDDYSAAIRLSDSLVTR